MAPKTDRSIITDDSVFRKDLFVFDVIYNPEETLFLKKAKATRMPDTERSEHAVISGSLHHLNSGQEKEMPVDIIKEKYFSR